MYISKRASEAQSSPIRKFVPLLEKTKKEGVEVFELHIGQPDIETPKEILSAIKKFNKKIIPYTPSSGIPETITAWQKYFKGYKMNFDASEIIVTAGGSEAILFAMAAVADYGDEILVFEPFYANYNGYASIANIKLKPITLKAENGFHLPSKKEIEKCISKKTKAILICNPNNPTGTVYTKKEIEMIVAIAKEHDLFILSDEVYREFVYDDARFVSPFDFAGARERIVIMDSISKRFNACGVRIGCVASKNKEIMQAILKFAQARLSVPLIEQLASVKMLENSKKYTRKIAMEYKKRRDVAFVELAKIKNAFCVKPRGAFYMTIKLPIKDSDDFAKWLLEKFRYKNQTVMVAPASGFYSTKGLGKDEIRVAFVLDSGRLKKAMQVLGIAIGEYVKKG